MKTVVITGVAGFIGRHVARHFSRDGWNVVGIDELPEENVQLSGVSYHRLVLPEARLIDLLRSSQPEVCVHCAGRASVGLSMEEPAADFRGNTALVFELLDALRRVAARCRFLLLSSAAVYGNPSALPVTEEQSIKPLSPYGYHKRQAELLCEEFSQVYGLSTLSARIFSAYGPGLRRQVVWDICEKILTTGQLTLRGTGEESRDFIHAVDIARALSLFAAAAPAEGEVYNLANGNEVTIAELAGLLLSALGSTAEAQFDGVATPGNPLRWHADVTKSRAVGFVPSIPLDQGLKQVAAWCAAELAAG